MSEIEKLMQNAGVKIQYGYDIEYNKKNEHYRLLNCNKNAVITLFPEYKSKGYEVTKVNKAANFTAEKQLSLIRWLCKTRDFAFEGIFINDIYYLGCRQTKNINTGKYYISNVENKNFEDALASLINNLWQDLTEEEKAEIKEILK